MWYFLISFICDDWLENKCSGWKGSKRVRIRGSESPENHTLYVWDNFIQKSQARDVVIVAHSYGGVCTMNLLKYRCT